jgi:putative dimethyl sulfoxide reductase chaperone
MSTTSAPTAREPESAVTAPPYDPDAGTARADLLRFLAACYYEPAPLFAEARLFESMRIAASKIDPALAERARALGAAFAADDLHTLLVDYTRLFIGPVQPPARPYESCWLGGEPLLLQGSTLAVLELYRQGGFDLDPEFHELPDHVAVELEFLYALTLRGEQARHAGDAGALAEIDALRARFVDEHLGAWIGRFSDAVERSAQTAFYRELAAMTRRCIAGRGATQRAH